MAASNFSLPFGIDFVVSQDLKGQSFFDPKPAASGSYDITCPFCFGKRKMNINPSKNVARCNKCGAGDGFNTITLHAALTGLSTKDSFRDLMKRYKGLDSDVKASFNPSVSVPKETVIPAPLAIRDKVYRAFLSQLFLSEQHRLDLRERGLSDEFIDAKLYKTVPSENLHTLAVLSLERSGVLSEITEHPIWGIPGIYDLHDMQKVSYKGRKNGFLIPVISNGLISGMQIRYDNLPDTASEEEKAYYRKYTWYSSSDKEIGCGVTGCENIHFAGDWNTVSDTICLTEGVLKADVASFLSGKPFLGLVGVNNVKQLAPTLTELQKKGTKTVRIYVDMDYREKPEVSAALLSIKKEINAAGQLDFELLEDCEHGLMLLFFQGTKGNDRVEFVKNVPWPKEPVVFLDKDKVPEKHWQVHGQSLMIDLEYMAKIRNDRHILTIVDSKLLPKNYVSFSSTEKREALKQASLRGIVFIKRGIAYKEIDWNPKYKGIDDYYKNALVK